MSVFLSRRWKRQPQGAVEIDWANPLARGLCACAIPGGGVFDPVRRGVSQATGDYRALDGGPDGRGFGPYSTWANSTIRLSGDNPAQGSGWLKPSGGVTVLAYVWARGARVGASPILMHGAATQAPYAVWSLFMNASGVVGFGADPGGVSTEISDPTSATIIGSRPIVLIGTYDGAAMRLYKDGREFNNTAASGALDYFAGSTGNNLRAVAIGSYPSWDTNDRRFDGAIYLCSLWDRGLSAVEARAISENPWQVFRPRTIRAYPTIPAAPTGPAIPVVAHHYRMLGAI